MLKDGKVIFDGCIADGLKPEMLIKVYDFDVTSYSGV
jgi:iron complex transport system ATP-binding protein